MIPKIIHQIWMGNKDIPPDFTKFIQKWKEMYFDFTYIMWTDSYIRSTDIIPKEKQYFFDSSDVPIVMKADILRYEILKKYGGIYIDIDTEPLRRMDDYIFDFDLIAGYQQNGEVNIALIGSDINIELIRDVCNSLIDNVNYKISSGFTYNEIQHLTGPVFFTSICKKYINKGNYKFFDSKYFYPYWFLELSRRNEDFRKISPEAYSVHHWAHSWK